jgi:hypothetical protein
MNIPNYQKDLKIEVDALDIEWVRHPQKYMAYCEMSAQANDVVRRKKNDLEVIDAKIDKEIRESAEGSSSKLTADAIKNRIIADERHLTALMNYNDALYQAELLTSAVKAMDSKKVALQEAVRLWAGAYFAGPKVPRDLRKEVEKAGTIEEDGLKKETEEVRERAAARRERKNKDEVN